MASHKPLLCELLCLRPTAHESQVAQVGRRGGEGGRRKRARTSALELEPCGLRPTGVPPRIASPPEGRPTRRSRPPAGSPHGRPRAPRQSDSVLLLLLLLSSMARSCWGRARQWLAGGWGPAACGEARSPARRGVTAALRCSCDGRCGRTRWRGKPAGGGWRRLVRGKPVEAAGVSSFIPWGMKTFTMRSHERTQDGSEKSGRRRLRKPDRSITVLNHYWHHCSQS
jgi:hypothetical protein